MTFRSDHVILLFVIALVLAGNCLLTSSGPGVEEGAVPWSLNSWLHPLVEVLNLRYRAPTPLGVEIKTFVFGAGTAVAVAVVAIGWFATRRERRPGGVQEGIGGIDSPVGTDGSASDAGRIAPGAASMSALTGGQLFFLLLVAYSLLSAKWCFAADYALWGLVGLSSFALGGTVVLATNVLWAVCLGRGLNRSAARVASSVLLWIITLTAALAVWYFYERNPHFRAKYPVGNPLFLAAVLLPAIVLACCMAAGRVIEFALTRRLASLRVLPLTVAALVAMVWAFVLTGAPPSGDADIRETIQALILSGPRAALVGLGVGLFSIPFFLCGRRGRLALGVLGIALIVGAAFMVAPRWQSVEQFGRGATARLRLYAWSYAWQMLEQRNLTGVGQGGYTILADGAEYAGRDAISDPLAFRGRLAHAHNEWIETWADLGTLGLALLVVAHLLTLIAGCSALSRFSDIRDRWLLAGLLAALVAMGTEEFFDVALRVPGLPAVYYTVIGLIWALCGAGEEETGRSWRLHRPRLRPALLAGAVAVSLLLLALYQRDFSAARAQLEAPAALRREQADRAVEAAEFAASARLEPARRLEARMQLLGTYAGAARIHLDRMRHRQERIEAEGLNPNHVQQLIREDRARASAPLRNGLTRAEELRDYSGGQVHLGSIEADLCAMLAELAEQQGQSESVEELRVRAVRALRRELSRNRFDEPLALRYLNLARTIPPAEQVEVLCGPLRGGSFGSDVLSAAAELAREPAFARTLQLLVEQADRDFQSGDPLSWQNPFSPEVCRLAAAAEARARRFESAIALASRAADLYAQGRNRDLLGLCRAQTLLSLGWYAFLRDPQHPESARDLTERAVQTVPSIGEADLYRAPMCAQLISICLAAGDEKAARRWAEQAEPSLEPETLDLLIGRHYAIVSEALLLSDAAASQRFLDRAERLAGSDTRVRWAAARIAFQLQDDQRVVDEIRRLIEIEDPQKILAFVRSVLTQRPDARLIKEAYEQLQAQGRLPGKVIPSEPAPRSGSQPTGPGEN